MDAIANAHASGDGIAFARFCGSCGSRYGSRGSCCSRYGSRSSRCRKQATASRRRTGQTGFGTATCPQGSCLGKQTARSPAANRCRNACPGSCAATSRRPFPRAAHARPPGYRHRTLTRKALFPVPGISCLYKLLYRAPRKTSGLAKRAKIFPMKSKGNFSDSMKQGSFSRCPILIYQVTKSVKFFMVYRLLCLHFLNDINSLKQNAQK